jgi:hypothetical protein
MDGLNKLILPGIILLLTLVSGVWLSRAGKPLNGLLFNIHKLIALAAVVLNAIQIAAIIKGTSPQAILIILMAASAVTVVVLFASGALMSIGKLGYNLLHTFHRVATLIFLLSLAGIIYRIFITNPSTQV